MIFKKNGTELHFFNVEKKGMYSTKSKKIEIVNICLYILIQLATHSNTNNTILFQKNFLPFTKLSQTHHSNMSHESTSSLQKTVAKIPKWF